MIVSAYLKTLGKLPALSVEGTPITLFVHRFGGTFRRKRRGKWRRLPLLFAPRAFEAAAEVYGNLAGGAETPSRVQDP